MNVDGQGLARVTYQEWMSLYRDQTLWTYRGGERGGPMFLIYAIGREIGGPSTLPPPSLQNRETVLMYALRDDWVCHLCRMTIEPNARGRHQASVDHLTPRVDGGSDYPSNLRIAHIGCNKSRGSRSVSAHVARREALMPTDVSVYARTHDRKWKGREIGSGREVREETFHHGVQLGDAPSRETAPVVASSPLGTRDEMMSLTAIENEPRFARVVRVLR